MTQSVTSFQYGLSDFTDEETAQQIQKFFDNANTPIVARPVKKVLETIRKRVKVLERDSKSIETYLKKQ